MLENILEIFLGFIKNLMLLFMISYGYSYVAFRFSKRKNITRDIFMGVFLSILALISMLSPIPIMKGLIIDSRVVIVSLAGFMGGWIPGALAAVVSGAYRLYLGGIGAIAGSGAIVLAALLGIIFFYKNKKKKNFTLREFFILGVILAVQALLWGLVIPLPFNKVIAVILKMALPVVIYYPFATTVLGVLLMEEEKRWKTEKDLRESREKYRRLVKSLENEYLVFSHDVNGVFNYLGSSVENILGFTKEEFMTHFTEYLTSSPINQEAIEHTNATLRGEKQGAYELESYHKNGSVRTLEVLEFPIFDSRGKVIAVEGVARDITERKKIESELRESESRFRQIADSIDELFWLCKPDWSEFYYVSPAYKKIWGRNPHNIYKNSEEWLNGVIEEDREKAIQAISMMIQSDVSEIDYPPIRVQRPDGSIRWVKGKAFPIYENGKVVRLAGVASDVTEKKDFEKELKIKESAIESSITAMTLASSEGVLFYANPAFVNMWGYQDKSEVIGRKISDFWLKDNTPYALSELSKKGYYSDESKAKRKNGSVFDCSRNASVVFDDAGKPICIMGSFLDITEKKKSQEMMIHNEKMISLGGLAAGIAHEINNPLGIILQSVQNIIRRFSVDLNKNIEVAKELGVNLEYLNKYITERKIDTYLDGIQEAGKRAADIVTNMLLYVRKSESKYSLNQINQVIEKAIGFVKQNFNVNKNIDYSKINIIKDLDVNLPMVRCSKNEIEQVFYNIISNAGHALIGDGLKIVKQSPEIRISTRHINGHVSINIKDNGPGMNQETQKKIFEPFFTTKPIGEGTGLGMYITYFIITEKHQGNISVKSRPGEGAEFIIMLPIEPKK